MKKFFSLILFIFVVSCSRCEQVHLDMPLTFIEEKECTSTDEEILLCFWKEFNDPLLTYLIETAFYENRDYLIAQEKVIETRSTYLSELSKLLPQVDALFLADRQRNSLTTTNAPFEGGEFFNLFQAGLLASWEIDLFGKRRDQARAAYYDIATQIASKYALKLTIASEIATNYFALAAASEIIAINKKHVELQEELLAIAQARFDGGITNEKDVCNSKARLEERKAAIYFNEILLKENLNSIAFLIGKTPEETYCLFGEKTRIPESSKKIPCTIPCDLLSRRPDIRKAEYQLMAAGARVSASKKELFPTITLAGFFLYESSFFNQLFKSDSRSWDVSPFATVPIFHGGGIYANIEVNTSRQRQAVYNYENSVLDALSDVETSMALYFNEERRLKHLKESVTANKCAMDVSTSRYQAGIIDFRFVIDDEEDLHDSEVEAILSNQHLMLGLLLIYKSLGGGWDWSCLP